MNIFTRLYRGEHDWDFVRVARKALVISALLIIVSFGSFLLRGLNLGIDFEGGVVWELPSRGTSVEDTRDALRPLGLADARIQILRGGDEARLRVQTGPRADTDRDQVTGALAEEVGVDVADVSVNEVGPSWGDEITRAAVRALIVFFVLVAAYIALRFEWKMAVAALVAVVHDIILSVGIYSLLVLEVTPATVISFLTILGYSLYDTIVVFDKVRENGRLVSATGLTYTEMVNRSLNEVLMRSVNTIIAALLPILSILVVGSWILGAVTLQEFGLALFVGMAVGAYSSVFVAAPVLALLKEREPRMAAIRARHEGRGGVVRPAAAGAASPVGARRAGSGPLRPGSAGGARRAAPGPGTVGVAGTDRPEPAGAAAGDVPDPDADDAVGPSVPAPGAAPDTAGAAPPADRPRGPASPVPSRSGQAPRGRKKGRRR